MTYTLGLKRKFLPGFKKYKVTSHDVGGTEGAYRLLLSLADGAHLYVFTPSWKLFPDYHSQATAAATQAAQLETAKAEAARAAVDQYRQLEAARAAQRPPAMLVPPGQRAAGMPQLHQ